jgi:hypothetical protein
MLASVPAACTIENGPIALQPPLIPAPPSAMAALQETGFPIDSSTPPEAKPDGDAESSAPVNCRCTRKPEYGLGGAVVLTFTRMFPPTSEVELIEIVPPVPAVGVAAWAGRTLIAAAPAAISSAKSVRTTGVPFTVCSPL